MFGLIWGPTLAAVSVVLDNASEAGAVQRALDCLLLAARMAAYHQVGGCAGARVGGSGKCWWQSCCWGWCCWRLRSCTLWRNVVHSQPQGCGPQPPKSDPRSRPCCARCGCQVDEVVDTIVASLAKFAVVLQPPRGALVFGESLKARAALETMFAIANRWGGR